ncbi:DNA-binding domain-containing protein [Vibrio mytili]|uniref:Putative DNA-binding domain-containing protein n=1 Tax=Vibrio mytili TaxID=50718 RepID=A0A0C3E5Q4_9VIBR|nr:DNA-binding domain-containing protein [Vibrio mytili]KIN09703.1 hypothetical protein SU60_17790 [Vibrio mytili]
MNLATLQNQFAKALHYQALGEECDIMSDKFTADKRMQIYRNNFVISLSEILAATYPMINALVGEECFSQIARQHVLSHPLEEGNVVHYGAGFQDTIMQFSQVMTHAPYIPEVARFEWSMDLARQVYGEQIAPLNLMPLSALTNVTEEQQPHLVFHLRTGSRHFDSNYAVIDLFHAIQRQDFEQLNINQLQQGVIATQSNGDVTCHALNPDAFQLLRALEKELSLSEIPQALFAQLNHIFTLDLISGYTLKGQ